MLWALAAFFLAMGVAAHALDELHGRPLRTRIPGAVLVAIAVVSLAGAVAIGVGAAVAWGLGPARLRRRSVRSSCRRTTSSWRCTPTGASRSAGARFPALTGYFVEAQTLRVEAVAAAGYAFVLSLAQRALSTPVRDARRERSTTAGTEPLERALRLLVWASVLIAVALVAARLR